MPNSTHESLGRLSLLASMAVLAAGCATGCKGWVSQPTSTAQQHLSVPDAESLEVEIRNGGIKVVRDPEATALSIDATVRCAGVTDEEAKARVDAAKVLAVRDADGKVRVTVEFPPAESDQSRSQDAVTLTIRAADLDGLTLTTSNGRIELGGFTGAATLRTSNGSVTVTGHDGPVDASTSNGSISASDVAAPLRLRSSNGKITATVLSGTEGDVTIRTSNGSIELDLPATWQGAVSTNTSNGRVTLEGGSRARDVDTGKTSGSMSLGDAAKAKATAETSNGSVRVRVAE